ncbi:RAVE subunit 2/Rogdi [Calycina marina]|uniref:RAVE subunit 2/Rogdi n=1 Tax=Calycina marina TaxID=1763456 RepID=A0A9P7YXE7_9HELO|nr:RAVE subunit 2/Rogdi [Calycina marina]
MSTAVWPSFPTDQLKREEDFSAERELAWLLESVQETLASLKSGLENCYALLAPIEPGSTLVMSSPRSESVKGHITRVGTRVVKGTLHLRLKTVNLSPLVLSLSADPLILAPLSSLRTLLNSSLDCIDISRWTGDRSSSSFISSQLHLLHSLILEALALLQGPPLLQPENHTPKSIPRPGTPLPEAKTTDWNDDPIPASAFDPPLPPYLALNLSLCDSSLVLTIRALEPASKELNLGEKFAFAIGAQRRLEHDEMDDVFLVRGESVRVKEKVRVEGSADPSLLSLGAKLSALERTVDGARRCLGVVSGKRWED